MLKTIKQYLEIMKYWLGEISKHNDKTIKVTEDLRIALINLKIEEAHLTGISNGIRPIADLIERSINELHDSTENMVTNGRKALRESYAEVEKYIDEREGDI
jgi:hypothetical protein